MCKWCGGQGIIKLIGHADIQCFQCKGVSISGGDIPLGIVLRALKKALRSTWEKIIYACEYERMIGG